MPERRIWTDSARAKRKIQVASFGVWIGWRRRRRRWPGRFIKLGGSNNDTFAMRLDQLLKLRRDIIVVLEAGAFGQGPTFANRVARPFFNQFLKPGEEFIPRRARRQQ